ncbi:RidA family protein [Microbacterium allomyrinae]|uniref:RidA family protein n=1 Tax=Microbacterium allomyrinae TaxID=2830666 RepID=A0A9X1LWR7_9MICO|nr:RidA family protein [Microbacterium allomyrinae]MCC2033287.1 RidA family protein [Microbacterium allomyrinae]
MPIIRTDPAGLYAVPGLISLVAAPHDADLVYLSGQIGWDADGVIQDPGDHAAQTAQIARNIDIALASLGVTREAIVKETVYVVDWSPELIPVVIGGLRDGSAAPASTLVAVAALAFPDALVEVEVVVAVPRPAHPRP